MSSPGRVRAPCWSCKVTGSGQTLVMGLIQSFMEGIVMCLGQTQLKGGGVVAPAPNMNRRSTLPILEDPVERSLSPKQIRVPRSRRQLSELGRNHFSGERITVNWHREPWPTFMLTISDFSLMWIPWTACHGSDRQNKDFSGTMNWRRSPERPKSHPFRPHGRRQCPVSRDPARCPTAHLNVGKRLATYPANLCPLL